MLEEMSKFPLGQLQFYIFTEIVFGVRCTLRRNKVVSLNNLGIANRKSSAAR